MNYENTDYIQIILLVIPAIIHTILVIFCYNFANISVYAADFIRRISLCVAVGCIVMSGTLMVCQDGTVECDSTVDISKLGHASYMDDIKGDRTIEMNIIIDWLGLHKGKR